MFKEIRRSERALSDAELHEIILKTEYGVLSTKNREPVRHQLS